MARVEEELLAKAKEFLSEQSFEKQGSWMSDTDFKFVGPVVGPLGKEEYLKAISGFDVFGIFPDLNPNYYGLTVDPMEEGRVWAISRTSATNTETLEPIESPACASVALAPTPSLPTAQAAGHHVPPCDTSRVAAQDECA